MLTTESSLVNAVYMPELIKYFLNNLIGDRYNISHLQNKFYKNITLFISFWKIYYTFENNTVFRSIFCIVVHTNFNIIELNKILAKKRGGRNMSD